MRVNLAAYGEDAMHSMAANERAQCNTNTHVWPGQVQPTGTTITRFFRCSELLARLIDNAAGTNARPLLIYSGGKYGLR